MDQLDIILYMSISEFRKRVKDYTKANSYSIPSDRQIFV